MIKDILQQLAPLDEKIAALRGDPADENMTDITNHAAELAELSAQEDALLSGCGALTAEDRVFLARHPERPHIDEIVDALFTDFFEQCGEKGFSGSMIGLSRPAGHGHRPPQGQHAGGKPALQLRYARAGGLPQGLAPDEAGGKI